MTIGLTPQLPAMEKAHLAPTYKRPDVVFVRGQGVHLYDADGREYLDGLAGIAVNALGHAHPDVVAAIKEAAGGLIHVSNLHHTEPALLLARDLCALSFADKIFFTNSGTEAVEGALKMSRLTTGKIGFVAFEGSFHGRSMGALSVTSTEKYRKPYEPLIPGVTWAPLNDFDAASKTVGDGTAAVIVEPIQGEGGIRAATPEFLRHLRRLCDAHGAVLIFDEVQCGLGRTGQLWAHATKDGVSPDLMTLAKPLGGGLPIGAILMNARVASALHPGDHGSTFAGGPFVTSVARVVLSHVSDAGFLAHVRRVGAYLETRLRELDSRRVVEVRGRGMMWGVQLEEALPVADVVDRCLAAGLVIGSSGGNTVRIVPPLIFEESHVDTLINRLRGALQ